MSGTGTIVARSLSHVQLSVTPRTAARQAPLSFSISQSLLRFVCIVLVMPSNHLLLCHPLLLPSVFPSIRVFSNEDTSSYPTPLAFPLGCPSLEAMHPAESPRLQPPWQPEVSSEMQVELCTGTGIREGHQAGLLAA